MHGRVLLQFVLVIVGEALRDWKLALCFCWAEEATMSAWTDQIWDSVEGNGIARRNVESTSKYGGLFRNDGISELVSEAKQRGYHVVKMGEQLVVFKHVIEVLC